MIYSHETSLSFGRADDRLIILSVFPLRVVDVKGRIWIACEQAAQPLSPRVCSQFRIAGDRELKSGS